MAGTGTAGSATADGAAATRVHSAWGQNGHLPCSGRSGSRNRSCSLKTGAESRCNLYCPRRPLPGLSSLLRPQQTAQLTHATRTASPASSHRPPWCREDEASTTAPTWHSCVGTLRGKGVGTLWAYSDQWEMAAMDKAFSFSSPGQPLEDGVAS